MKKISDFMLYMHTKKYVLKKLEEIEIKIAEIENNEKVNTEFSEQILQENPELSNELDKKIKEFKRK